MNISLPHSRPKIAINIVSAFLILALLRLLPFNFFTSILIGHDVVIDNKEGNAINFINYISVVFFFIITFLKLPTIKARWIELWPFGFLIIIYCVNFFMAPYVNSSWICYQFTFILIAAFIHILISGQSGKDYQVVKSTGGLILFIGAIIFFLAFVCVIMYSKFSIEYIIAEFNDSFLNSLSSFGVMKQYYGYIVGFILLYSFFVIKNNWLKGVVILLVCLSAFGIRSFVLGMMSIVFFMNIKNPIRLLSILLIACFISYLLWDDIIVGLLYDTRFYAYMNAWDIVHKFPYGVGLGGYPTYTEIYNNDLFASFFTIDAALNYVPNSPESDIVHVFGSLGLVFGSAHLFIQLRLIILGLFQQVKMLPFEKCMFFYFIFITAFGISEDTMFTVSYWIFFGVTSGIISSVMKRNLHD